MEGIMIVFDFDKTIIDCDSDNWVIDELGFTHRFDQLLNTIPWNSMMVCLFLFDFRFCSDFHFSLFLMIVLLCFPLF